MTAGVQGSRFVVFGVGGGSSGADESTVGFDKKG
jgi:hypothetical protein